jgi:hypothetical protein
MTIRLDSPTARIAVVERRRRAHAHVLCRQHAAPLLAMASMILEDADAATDIVAATLAAACRPVEHSRPSSTGTRVELARSAFWRCIGLIATTERFGPGLQQPSNSGSDLAVDNAAVRSLVALSANHRAVMALTLFGGHDLRQAGVTLQMSVPQVVRCILEVILFGTPASRPAGHGSYQQFGPPEH